MHDFINGTKRFPDISPDMLFVNDSPNDGYVQTNDHYDEDADDSETQQPYSDPVRKRGRIVQLKGGYGFISTDIPQKNLFFFTEQLRNCEFNELQPGDLMEYEPGYNDRGECCKNVDLIAHPAARN